MRSAPPVAVETKPEGQQRFGAVLRAARIARRVSLREFARRVHYSHSYLSKVENGVKPPTQAVAQQCDQALGLEGVLAALTEPAAAATHEDWPSPVQLPPGPSRFVGRTAELDSISAALAEGDSQPGAVPLVVLDGPPGVGKTATALRWAHQNLARFSDGVLFADLRGHSPADDPARPTDVLEEFLRAMGMTERVPAREHQRAASLRSLLMGRRVLLLLDNALDTPQVRALLPSSPGCAVVVTSRRRLLGLSARDGARTVSVGPLNHVESGILMREVIGEPRTAAEPEAARTLAGHCGGLPLALRLAGEKAAAQPDRSLAAVAAEMSSANSLLDALATDDDPHSAVRSVFSSSYRVLDPGDARVFRFLGRHPHPEFGESETAPLAGLSIQRCIQSLRRLATAHLIEPASPGRYRMHELLHLYANELATTGDSVE
jgi:transcriptional regulator with XRE-family HTH domain